MLGSSEGVYASLAVASFSVLFLIAEGLKFAASITTARNMRCHVVPPSHSVLTSSSAGVALFKIRAFPMDIASI